MDQSTADVAEETQKPKNQENYKYRPQHKFYFRLIAPADYVQPRSKKIKSKIGIGIPRSQSRMYPVAPASLILFIKCMFVLSLEGFTSPQSPFGVLPWICPASFGAGPEVPHLSLRQTLGRCRLIDRTFVSVCLSLHSNRL